MKENGNPAGDWWAKLATALGFKPQQAGMVRLLLITVAIGILAMTVLDGFGGHLDTRKPSGATEVSAPPGAPQDELARMEQEMATGLARTLSMVKGAGKVEVSVTLEAGPAVTAITDTRVDRTTSNEKAADNSTRETVTEAKQVTALKSNSGGGDALVVARKDRAVIAGVVVVADGARDAKVREMLHRATVDGLRISPNRVTVVPREGDK